MNRVTKILVISNSAADQRAQHSVLASAELDWEVDFCDSGAAALEKAGALQPHCIVLDDRLPDMSGLDCFHAMRRVSRIGVPVLMLITQRDEAAVLDALRAGVQDYLFKDTRGNYLALLPTVLKKTLREHRTAEEKVSAQAALSQLARKYEYLFLGVTDGIILADEDRVIESINPAACRIFGYEAYELCGRPLMSILRPNEHAPHQDEFTRYLKTGGGRFVGKDAQEVRGLRKGGKLFPLELTITEISIDGRAMFAAVMRDTSERHLARTAMLESEERFRGAFDHAPIGMALVALDGRWLKVNPALCEIVGYAEDEMLALRFQDMTHPDDLDIDQTFVQLVLAGQLKTYQMETRYFHKDGHAVPVTQSSSLVRGADGKPLYFISKIENITQRRKMEDALYAEKDLAQTTLQSIGDAVITTDAGGRVAYLNPAAERLTGWNNLEAAGLPLDQVFVLVNETTREIVPSPVVRALEDGKLASLASNTILIARNGVEYHIDHSAAPIRVRDGRLTGFVMVFHDVTEARKMSRKISFLASHDALTGLYNRSEFELAAARLLHSAKTLHLCHSLLFMDLDQFKAVNDTCGHLAGDQLLCQLSNVLLARLRKSDMLARLGGDEFGILLESCPPARAEEIARHLIDTVGTFRFEWEGKLFTVGASIGLVPITGQSTDIQSLLGAADTACYLAKDKGRNRVQVFERGDDAPRERQLQVDWVTRLREAIEQNRFALYSQTVVPLGTRDEPAHQEVLLRYRDEHGRLLLPMAFIPAAERYGLLPAIDRWVIATLLREPPASLFVNDAASTIAVNLSGASIIDPDFQRFVLAELHASSIPPKRLCFEITEAAAITHLHRSINFMQMLRDTGCRFALDNFGGSLSSFQYLKSLPVDYLKIDGNLVKGIAQDAVDYAMVESIHRIATVMRVRSIAKFVESDDILRQLRTIGVDYAQGFCLHEPAPLA